MIRSSSHDRAVAARSLPRPKRERYSSGTRSCWSKTNRAPRSFSGSATRKSRSGGLQAWTTSNRPGAGAPAASDVPERGRRTRAGSPAGPPVAAVERVAVDLDAVDRRPRARCPACAPAGRSPRPRSRPRVSAWHSCQTRRSKGTERFSTRMSAPTRRRRAYSEIRSRSAGFRQADEVDDHAGRRRRASAATDLGRRAMRRRRPRRARRPRRRSSTSSSREVRQVLLDVLAVGADEARQVRPRGRRCGGRSPCRAGARRARRAGSRAGRRCRA